MELADAWERISWKEIALVIAVFLGAVLFWEVASRLLIVIALFAFAILPSFLKRRLEDLPLLMFEFGTFSTVLVGVITGPLWGAIFGVVMTATAATIERGLNFGTPLSLLLSAGIGLLAQPLSSYFGIVTVGMILLIAATIIGNGFNVLLQADAEITTLSIVGTITNTSVNFLLFTYFGERLLSLV